MKTTSELHQEIKDIEYSIRHEEMKPAVEKRLRKRIPFLKTCIAYVETNPSQTFMKSEVEKVENKIRLRMAQFSLDDYQELDKKTVTKLRKEHEKKYEIPHLREQLKTLKFLLK